MEFDKKKFGYRLSDLLHERELTQYRAEIEIGLPPGSLTHYVNGKVSPTAARLVKICRYLNVSADYLLGLTDLE